MRNAAFALGDGGYVFTEIFGRVLRRLRCWLRRLPRRRPRTRELRLSHQLPESDARHRASRVLAAELKKRAPALSISIHPNSSLKIPPTEQYEAMLEGKIEMTIYPMGYTSAKFPELSIVTMPGVPSNAEAAGLLKGTEFEEKLQQLCEEKGFRILTWWWLDGGMASRTRRDHGPRQRQGPDCAQRGGDDFNSMLAAAGASIADHAVERGPPVHGGRQARRRAELVRAAREPALPGGRASS